MGPQKKLSFAEAARGVLKRSEKPLHYEEITQQALAAGLLQTSGKTPAATMGAVLAVAIKRKGDGASFIRTAPGHYGLRGPHEAWVESGAAESSADDGVRVKVPLFPPYDAVAAVLPVWAQTGNQTNETTGRAKPEAEVGYKSCDTTGLLYILRKDLGEAAAPR